MERVKEREVSGSRSIFARPKPKIPFHFVPQSFLAPIQWRKRLLRVLPVPRIVWFIEKKLSHVSNRFTDLVFTLFLTSITLEGGVWLKALFFVYFHHSLGSEEERRLVIKPISALCLKYLSKVSFNRESWSPWCINFWRIFGVLDKLGGRGVLKFLKIEEWLAQLGERRTTEREVAGSNPGRNNTQCL